LQTHAEKFGAELAVVKLATSKNGYYRQGLDVRATEALEAAVIRSGQNSNCSKRFR